MTNTPTLGDLINAVEQLHTEPLKQLTDAVLIAQHLNEVADHLIGHFVDRARHSGASWTEIGQSMGVTKQAAQKRFTSNAPEQLDVSQFARFTDKARITIVASEKEAERLKHAEITPGHILLGLFAPPDALAIRALTSLGGKPETIIAAVTPKLGPAVENPPSPHTPFSGQSKKVLELTVREALRLGHNYVGTEHILLGLVALDDTVIKDTFSESGVPVDRIEAAVVSVLPPEPQAT
ncbi:ATP-dependent Clp protease ATP-binding subunit [Kibdelosporangium philippinense]|uniref:ATP-dependent Clp protease ATP-binding subunit n=1 Tax=Kibdelosporangium philippinense TaxID=211113 RepID=A0ABS8ZIK6_9PSEU|nr:Clp protease N-terminal domain-containing protein [Kibdelosporangium philippinense]MCE7007397.1 ATP-dependent Clp protease ATP-binding subunit [Kibdelosporangium philippinense]